MNSKKQIHPARSRGICPHRLKPHFWYQFCISLGLIRQEKAHSKLSRGNLGQSNTFKDLIQFIVELEL